MEKYILSPEMVWNKDGKAVGHQFKDIEVYGGKTHFGDCYNYHTYHQYTSGDPQKELNKEIEAYRNVLFLTDPIGDLESLKSTKGKRTEGTCEWIRDNEHYKAWLYGETQCLSVCGGPGKGKTMLSIFLTEELERHTKTMGSTELLFYFCSHRGENYNSAVTILRSLIYQLLPKCRDFFTSVSSYFESPERTKMALASADTLWVILRTLIQSKSSTTYCVLDGFDNCDYESSRLLTTKFGDFFLSVYSNRLKLVIVSRKMAGLENFPQLKLDPDNDELLSGDIQRFISASVHALERIPGFNDIRQNVEATLLERAQGTFLWVGFVMGELSKKRTCSGIVRSLEDFPPGLDVIYSRMLLQATESWQMESDEKNIMSDILRWVTMAVRPLTLQELTVAIALSTAISDEQVIRDQITLCEPILKIEGLKVKLVHQSVGDYLRWEKPDDDPILENFRIKAPKAHAQIAKTCLKYIENSDLRYEYLNIEDASVLQKSPLLNYAALHWLEHAGYSSMYGNEDYQLSRPFFCKESPVRTHWWKAYINSEQQRCNGEGP
ncbi:uncharacterized protein N7458_011661 [Penicillium daleae]|uniref:NACHT domain-containing protein n=1 Tax=Penicillium daleae TaxID=63821 RepID=A0AAD6BV60_9EURO|nr:uncharacterized protein N7458_011661 [Penicillium daleae]KAJ5432505.1 hypothetical protein N7458_011661 [Penicillium daleae]